MSSVTIRRSSTIIFEASSSSSSSGDIQKRTQFAAETGSLHTLHTIESRTAYLENSHEKCRAESSHLHKLIKENAIEKEKQGLKIEKQKLEIWNANRQNNYLTEKVTKLDDENKRYKEVNRIQREALETQARKISNLKAKLKAKQQRRCCCSIFC